MIPRICKKVENKSSTWEANKYTIKVESNITTIYLVKIRVCPASDEIIV
jgi:hypothetical protein